MNIKLVVDGAPVTPKDAAGNAVEPFSCNGTTYLPVRAVASALGKEVTWDGNTNTVYIGDAAYLPYQANHSTVYDGSDPNASFSVAGKVYKVGTVLHSFHSTNSFHPNPYDGDAIWNTEGKQTMTFTATWAPSSAMAPCTWPWTAAPPVSTPCAGTALPRPSPSPWAAPPT